MAAHVEARESFPDEHLTHWADVYVTRSVREYGVLLETFLRDPVPILAAIDHGRLRKLDLELPA